jgi:alkylation response protein AidB-like acyl-CoA dehydrogenase
MTRTDWSALARELGPVFAARAPTYDANDCFASDNYVELKQHRFMSAGIPAELGGGGATYAELCGMLRELGRYCGSTALALSMHTHLVATTIWRFHQGQPVAPLLGRIASDQLVLVSTGASDWLESSGAAVAVDGGYRVTARKIFGSGSPAGDLLMTSAPLEGALDGGVVLHFPVALGASGARVGDNWRALGMRATGSHDVFLENVFVPEEAVWLRRPRGRWHPYFNLTAIVALPIVMCAYLGVAEAARDLAVQRAQRKRDDPDVWYLVGEMDNALTTASLAVQSMVGYCEEYAFAPELELANAALMRKTIAAGAVLATVEKALEVVGGSGLFRDLGLERLLRDIHAAQFHPLQPKRQHRLSGRVALGLDPVG